MKKYYIIYADKPFNNVCENTATEIDGVIWCDYCKEPTTWEQYQKQRQDKNLKIITEQEMDVLWEQTNTRISDEWEEITADRYDEMLNVLPPVKWTNGGFYICEAYSGELHSFYQQWDKKYYTSIQPIRAKRCDIIKSLKGFIYKNVNSFS